MKPTSFFLVASALVALSSPLRADDATCPVAQAAQASATCPSAGGACCNADKNPSMTLRIKGDAEVVKTSLAKLEGVSAVNTCCESKLTKIAYAKDKVRTDKILAALKASGLRVEAQQVTYTVDGLGCDACSQKVSKALSKVKGVSDAKVCHLSKQAVVEFDPEKISAEKVLAAIDASGFKAAEVVN